MYSWTIGLIHLPQMTTNYSQLYIYYLTLETLPYYITDCPFFVLDKADVESQQPYAHTLLATLLSWHNMVIVRNQRKTILFSWNKRIELSHSLWMEYDIIEDRWGDSIQSIRGKTVPFSWQKFLHLTMDRFDRFMLTSWLEDAKQTHSWTFQSILLERIQQQLPLFKFPTPIWEKTRDVLLKNTKLGKD